MNFDIKTEQLGDDAYVISLAGEVDLYTAPEFKQQLLEVIGQGGKHAMRQRQSREPEDLEDQQPEQWGEQHVTSLCDRS